jgi:MSHA pilin protein MshC
MSRPIQIEAGTGECQKIQRGFTLVELITVMVIIGILAAMAAPRFFSQSVFDSRGFHDSVAATLRYAQKVAIAQHRYVCVAFTSSSATLTYGATTSCGSNLVGPTGTSPYAVSSNKTTFLSTPTAFNFNPLGQASTGQTIKISGATDITVVAETGYVY